ncbi:glycerate kinase [Sanguibacter sp. A247]|uniref:glycerate kinase n=1 Tax=unclassified Sanguibacter TaxID=2645534 RepID=UPI003FD731FF
MRRVVVAPDSFKGSLGAVGVAAAIARGWGAVRPDDVCVELPMADGGEGTLDALERAVPAAVRRPVTVTGPDDRTVRAAWLALPDGTAVVELACASGLTLLDRPLPLDAHTRGVGEVVRAALAARPRRLVVTLGGSASTDGGLGLLRALGARVRDASGQDVPDGGRGLARAASVELAELVALPPDGVEVWGDVTSPLCGPAGAAAVFGPQKGATPDDVALLDAALGRWSDLLEASGEVPCGTSGRAGVGAAGGTAFGLVAWGARLVQGAAAIADAVGLDAHLAGADLVLTGEGRLDAQSLAGKAPAEVARRARAAGLPVGFVVGSAEPGVADALAGDDVDRRERMCQQVGGVVVDLVSEAGSLEAALADPAYWLERAGAHLARTAWCEG